MLRHDAFRNRFASLGRLWRVVLKSRLFLTTLATLASLQVACAPAPQSAHPPEANLPIIADSPPAAPPFLQELVSPAPLAPTSAIAPFLAYTEETVIAAPVSKCNEQKAQAFLMRSTYVFQRGLDPEEAKRRKQLHGQAVEYRTRHYGLVEGFGDNLMNPRPPYDYTAEGKFFGLHVRMNKRVLVALGCVEETIQRTCANAPYVPQVLDGLRTRNTFHNNEVSNHLYGIAIDVDPLRNACCHCVAPSKDAPICKKPAKTPFDHAEITPCWVDAFEKYGFYWLGHDELEDTMHFEFLGDPNKIIASGTGAQSP